MLKANGRRISILVYLAGAGFVGQGMASGVQQSAESHRPELRVKWEINLAREQAVYCSGMYQPAEPLEELLSEQDESTIRGWLAMRSMKPSRQVRFGADARVPREPSPRTNDASTPAAQTDDQ